MADRTVLDPCKIENLDDLFLRACVLFEERRFAVSLVGGAPSLPPSLPSSPATFSESPVCFVCCPPSYHVLHPYARHVVLLYSTVRWFHSTHASLCLLLLLLLLLLMLLLLLPTTHNRMDERPDRAQVSEVFKEFMPWANVRVEDREGRKNVTRRSVYSAGGQQQFFGGADDADDQGNRSNPEKSRSRFIFVPSEIRCPPLPPLPRRPLFLEIGRAGSG